MNVKLELFGEDIADAITMYIGKKHPEYDGKDIEVRLESRPSSQDGPRHCPGYTKAIVTIKDKE